MPTRDKEEILYTNITNSGYNNNSYNNRIKKGGYMPRSGTYNRNRSNRSNSRNYSRN
jgi:hypothetical protein